MAGGNKAKRQKTIQSSDSEGGNSSASSNSDSEEVCIVFKGQFLF